MRLTLRTLLAYRDGVLSPAETTDLHQRIMHTEVARNLLQRIEALVEQKQMLAPKAIGTGLGGDANSVAEYLDDTLASDQVAEFERICIAESDLALAELAHCHRLLAEALNSKVHVPASLKATAVGLMDPANQAALAARLKPLRSISARDHAVVPASKVDGETRRLDPAHREPLVTAVEVASASVSNEATAISSESAERTHKTPAETPAHSVKSPIRAPLEAVNIAVAKHDSEKLTPVAHQVPDYLVGQSTVDWRIPAAIAALATLLALLVWQALGPLENVQNLFRSDGRAIAAADSATDQKQIDGLEPAKPDPLKSPNEKIGDRTTVNGKGVVLEPDVANVESPKQSELLKESKKIETDLAGPQQGLATETASPALPSVEAPAIVGLLQWVPSNRGEAEAVLLMRSTSADGAQEGGVGGVTKLVRLQPGAGIPDGTELIVPRFMRPTLKVGGVYSWTVCGPTQLKPQMDEALNRTILHTPLCRAIVKAEAEPSVLTVSSPVGVIEVRFADKTSMASIEVGPRRVALGAISGEGTFKSVAVVVAVEGQVSVSINRENGDTKALNLAVGEGAAVIDGQLVEFELGTIPLWYRASVERPLDSLAAADLHLLLNDNGSLESQLKTLCLDRRPETAALAIQASMMLGDWSGFAKNLLGNEQMRSHWESTLALAEQCLASAPANLELLAKELEGVFGEASGSIMELLIGTTPTDAGEQAQNALLRKLVDALDSDRLEERVVAAYQLKRLTGKDFGFQPSFPNRAALQVWRREVAKNSSTLMLPIGDPLWEAKNQLPD